MEKPISGTGDQPSPPRRGFCRRHSLGFTVGFVLCLVMVSGAVPTLRKSRNQHVFQVANDWVIWLPICQAVGMAMTGMLCGFPTSHRDRRWYVLLNGLLVGFTVLFAFRIFEYVRYRFYELLLRVFVAGFWGVVVIGCPFVLRWILRRHRGLRQPYPFAKWWFSTVLFLFVLEPTVTVVQQKQKPSRLPFPTELTEPSADEIHVVAVGGSTMVGYPYEPKFGIAEVVAHGLQRMYPRQVVVLHNQARPGLNLAHAVTQLKTLKPRPQLLLLYSAHNEFYYDVEEFTTHSSGPFGLLDRWFRYSPSFRIVDQYLATRAVLHPITYRPPGLLGNAIVSPELYATRLVRFRDQLRQLAEFCRREQIPTLWFIPAASELGFEPNRSCISGTITRDVERDIERVYEQGRELESAEDWWSAASLYKTALSRFPTFAEFHFRLGNCLFHLQKYREARKHYQQALENDCYPVRANADYRDSITLVAGEFDIPVVDSAEVLRPLSPHGILGRSLFHDNVHPTLEAFNTLGNAALKLIPERHLLDVTVGPPRSARPQDLFTAIAELKIERADLVSAYSRIAAGLNHLGLLRFDATNREKEAVRYQRMADRLRRGEINPGDGGTEALRRPTTDSVHVEPQRTSGGN